MRHCPFSVKYFEEILAGSFMVLMSLATFANVVARYFFSSPSSGPKSFPVTPSSGWSFWAQWSAPSASGTSASTPGEASPRPCPALGELCGRAADLRTAWSSSSGTVDIDPSRDPDHGHPECAPVRHLHGGPGLRRPGALLFPGDFRSHLREALTERRGS